MKKHINILLIEHSSKREIYADILSQTDAMVTLIEEFDLEQLVNALKENYFDFIVTDAFFLPKGVDHDSATEEDKYCLPDIVKTIRKFDCRVKIIVFTSYNERIDYTDLDQVDYLFDKRTYTSDLLKWQFERLKSELTQSDYEHELSTRLLDLLMNNPDLIWRTELIEMIEKYRNGINERDQIEKIKSCFIKIFQKCSLSEKASELFDMIKDIEPLNMAGAPTKFGHLRHVINVFWLGYYIINNDLIDKANLVAKSFSQNTELDNNILINEAWLMTALFHDIGHLGQNVPKLINSISEFISNYPSNGRKNEVILNCEGYTISDFDSLKSKIAGTSQGLHTLINDNHKEKKPDHGVLSALTVYELLKEDYEQKQNIFDPAIKAMALHNILEKHHKELKTYNFNEFPFENLLILCDHLEIWDRDTGFETMMNPIPIEKIELSEMNKIDNKLRLVYNYKMHRALITGNVDITESELIELIDKYVLPILKNMECLNMPKIEVEYLLNGRKFLGKWPISSS